MSKISQKTIDDVLDAVSVSDYERITGQKPKRAGSRYFINSPYSGEKTPSFCIFPDGCFKDFSSGKAGNIITLMMEKNGMEFPDAIQNLADHHSIIVERDGPDVDPEIREERDQMLECMKLAMNAYEKKRSELADDHKCITHLVKDRQLDQASIDLFKIGYAPDDGKWLTQRLVEIGMAIPAEKLGLIKKSDSGQYYDRIRDAIVFPICNANGTPLGFGARPFSGKPKYFNSSSSEIYDKSATLLGLNLAKKSIRIQKCAILVEGNFDVISMHRAGCTNTVATCGTALTADHCKQLKKHCKTVILMRDGDDAGMKAAKKDFELLMAHGFLVKMFQLTDGQDPDDFVREHMYMNPNENFADLKTEITA